MLITVPEIIVILFNGGLPYVQCTKNHLTCENYIVTHTHTHTHLTHLFLELPG